MNTLALPVFMDHVEILQNIGTVILVPVTQINEPSTRNLSQNKGHLIFCLNEISSIYKSYLNNRNFTAVKLVPVKSTTVT
jgi:hypothetical protein